MHSNTPLLLLHLPRSSGVVIHLSWTEHLYDIRECLVHLGNDVVDELRVEHEATSNVSRGTTLPIPVLLVRGTELLVEHLDSTTAMALAHAHVSALHICNSFG